MACTQRTQERPTCCKNTRAWVNSLRMIFFLVPSICLQIYDIIILIENTFFFSFGALTVGRPSSTMRAALASADKVQLLWSATPLEVSRSCRSASTARSENTFLKVHLYCTRLQDLIILL
ncbi:uncharacterized protein LOC143435568 [Arvicanthis niloticus]|uniref:uncharacterized protein LOC143309839 n=1 Tax=Arvicanthis niloticus TaxID=61156 RepID=UPI00402BE601